MNKISLSFNYLVSLGLVLIPAAIISSAMNLWMNGGMENYVGEFHPVWVYGPLFGIFYWGIAAILTLIYLLPINKILIKKGISNYWLILLSLFAPLAFIFVLFQTPIFILVIHHGLALILFSFIFWQYAKQNYT